MHPELQTRLLRVLSSQEFYRVGGHNPIKSDVRIITATNQLIEDLIVSSKFREDLYHRLNVFKLELPPLRERKEDIEELTKYFLKTSAKELKVEEKNIDKNTLEYFINFDWPGNIRQLENTCRYLTIMCSSSLITMDDVPEDIKVSINNVNDRTNNEDDNWKKSLQKYIRTNIKSDKDILKKLNEELERILIDESLKESNGVKLEAAKLLGWGRNTLARKVRQN